MMTDPKKRTDRTTRKATAGRGRKGRLDVPSVRIRRRRIDAGTTSRPYGVSPSPTRGSHASDVGGRTRCGMGGGVDYWQSMSKGGVENGVPMGRRGDRMAHRIRIRDIKGGSRHGKGMRRPLRTAIAVIVATAMLTPTIASAAPVVPDAPSPVPGVESSSPYADDGVTYTADGRPLYESASDTIYIYNALQTAVSRQDDAADQPVLTGDGDAETFGTGKPIYAEDSDEPLTYSPEHTYVYVDGWDEGLEDAGENNGAQLMAEESADTPEAQEEPDAEKNVEAEKDEQVEKNDEAEKNDVSATDPATTGESGSSDAGESTAAQDAATIAGAEVLSDGEDGTTGKVLLADESAVGELDGRDYVGQTVKNINGTDYILIGNEQQLRAIGSGGPVVDKVWWRTFGQEPYVKYRGDADLAPGEKLKSSAYTGSFLGTGYFGSNDKGEFDEDADDDTHLHYDADQNYIIFRDIDLSGSNWTPLMFSGKMIGAVAKDPSEKGTLSDALAEDGKNAAEGFDAPVISGIRVSQGEELDTDDYLGVGFFGTISSGIDDSGQPIVGASATVSNITISGASIDNGASKIKDNFSLLVWLVGGLLDLILGDSENLSYYATGVFAGRVIGEVSINDITVLNSKIDSKSKGYIGGIVGYSSGSTSYDGLSEALGWLTGSLSWLLNLIPGLGVGDLIELLLGGEGLIDVSKLIPVGYVAPVITGCTIDGLTAPDGAIGNTDSSYAGGLAGYLVATTVSNCEVKGADLSLTGKNYVGGFAGAVRNGSVEGTLKLDDLVALELWDYTPQSIVFQSKVTTSSVKVNASGDYAGGFAGGLANAYMINDVLDSTGSVSVSATGDSAGGFAGVASLGWQIDLGKRGDNESNRNSLLGAVDELLSAILTGQNPSEADPLLALVGIKETVMLGVQVKGTNVTVSASNNAGGLLGEGDGTVIASTHATVDGGEQGETYWNSEVPDQLKQHLGLSGDPADQGVVVAGLASVSASDANAGGIAGSLNVASGGGLVNNTLGLTNLIPFVVADVDVSGDGFTVSAAGDYAAGGVGVVTGGHVRNVEVSGVSAITASNYAGGFFGASGTGSVVSDGGINLLGLDLVQINNLLQVGAAVQTTVDAVTVSGVDAGMKVTATGDGTSTDAGEKPVTAGGFVALGSATAVSSAHVANLASVSANVHDGAIAANGQAGGFVGESTASGLADVADEDSILSLVDIDGLLGAVTYLLPTYKDVDVSFVGEASVKADSAGGFAGTFEAGTVDNSAREEAQQWAVYGRRRSNGPSTASTRSSAAPMRAALAATSTRARWRTRARASASSAESRGSKSTLPSSSTSLAPTSPPLGARA